MAHTAKDLSKHMQFSLLCDHDPTLVRCSHVVDGEPCRRGELGGIEARPPGRPKGRTAGPAKRCKHRIGDMRCTRPAARNLWGVCAEWQHRERHPGSVDRGGVCRICDSCRSTMMASRA